MAEIVNLRRVKKQRARAGEAAQAAENRVRHGQSRTEREALQQRRDAAARALDGAALARDAAPTDAGEDRRGD